MTADDELTWADHLRAIEQEKGVTLNDERQQFKGDLWDNKNGPEKRANAIRGLTLQID